MNKGQLVFSEEQIQRLFGHEAAEDEDIDRLREYYFKSSIYDQVVTDLNLRILVGHKGIGKSALFQIAIAEEEEAGNLTVLIKPDDIAEIGSDVSDFLKLVREWKLGLTEIITQKILSNFGSVESADESLRSGLARYGWKAIDFIKDAIDKTDKVNLKPVKKKLIEKFLKTSRIFIYIDDLDRGWQGRREDIVRISALLNAVRDISSENRGIKFRISLRSDVYFLVRTSDESTDKIEGSVLWHSWTNHEIFALLVKRIESFFGREVEEKILIRTAQPELAHYLRPVMEGRFSGRGHWENAPMYQVLMSLIRKRPRDLVKLCTLAARRSRERGSQLISTLDFESSFEEYSQGRLQDTINEFRSELPEIERLLLGMKPNKKEKTAKEGWVYTTDALLKKINNIRGQGEFRFSNKMTADSKMLAGLMYKVNFLTARKEQNNGIARKYFEESRYLQNQFTEFGFAWEIHPAYRWALQPDSIDDIFKTLELSTD